MPNSIYDKLFLHRDPNLQSNHNKNHTIFQGDSQTKWKTEKFKMFVGGSWWQPPPCNQYTIGVPLLAQPLVKTADIEKPPEQQSLPPVPPPKERETVSSSSNNRDRKSLLSSR